MEEEINKVADSLPGNKRKNRYALSFIRYADDFIIIHPSLDVIDECKQRIIEWLKEMGLELKPSKTKIVHTLNPEHNIRTQSSTNTGGFDFLGFNVRQYHVGKTHSGKNPRGKLLGFKTLIKPSEKAIKEHYDEICKTIDTHKSAPQEALIKRLNPLVRGWTNYYSSVVSKEIFALLDHLIFQKLQAWAKRRHPDKSKSWITSKYWGTVGNNNWVFSTKYEGKITFTLLKYAKTEIVRHIKVQGKNSPFDGNLVYWSERRGKNPLLPLRVTTLLKSQKGKCTHCGLHFREDDVMEVDHIIPKLKGGRNDYKNLQLLHRHCHDMKTTIFGSRYA
ncbi:MAG: group II intron maturase-specific domain-containing protein [Nostoc sp.]|uniref:group II intron reverse transcriptase n=1 Tax=Nostoc sp. TaxID=1180 RepID=UPI002FFAFEA9